MSNLRVFASAFLDGFSGAGLYEKLRQPGAATRLFADPPRRAREESPKHPSQVILSLEQKPAKTIREAGHVGR